MITCLADRSALPGRRSRAVLSFVIVALSLLATSAPTAAHGELVAASPEPGETVGDVSRVDLLFSTAMVDWALTIDGPDRQPVDGVVGQPASTVLSFEAPLTEDGQYIVRYSGIDTDGDLIEGAFAFVIDEGAPPAAGLPEDLAVVDQRSRSWWYVLLAGMLVIAALAGLLAGKVRRLRRVSASA